MREFYLGGSVNGDVWQCESIKLICEITSSPSLRVRHYLLYHNEILTTKQSNYGVFSIHRVGVEHHGIYACAPETRLGIGRNKTLRLNVKGQWLSPIGSLYLSPMSLASRLNPKIPSTRCGFRSAFRLLSIPNRIDDKRLIQSNNTRTLRKQYRVNGA